MTKGPRSYIPAELKKFDGVILKCESCTEYISTIVEYYDSEDFHDKVIDIGEYSGWTFDFAIMCRSCTIDYKNKDK